MRGTNLLVQFLLGVGYFLAMLTQLSRGQDSECHGGQTIRKDSLTKCFGSGGQFGTIALRNNGDRVFIPESSDDYQVFAIAVEASLLNCPDCHSVYIEIYGREPGGQQTLCASQQANRNMIGSPSDEFVLCNTPLSIVGFEVRVRGSPQELEHLSTRRLTFFYKMYMTKGCDRIDHPFPYILTKGAPCILPYLYDGVKTYDCVRINDKRWCGTTCQTLNGQRTSPLVECETTSSLSVIFFPANKRPLTLMSSRANILSNLPSAVVDRRSVDNPGLCLNTKDSESKALRGHGSNINWILVDLGVDTALRVVRLWRDELPLKGVQIWLSTQPPEIVWSRVRREELMMNNSESITFCGEVDTVDKKGKVSSVTCRKGVIGRWVLIQKRIVALSLCEIEFYKDDEQRVCYSDRKPTLDCHWKQSLVDVVQIVNGTYETVSADSGPFFFDRVLLAGTDHCALCNGTYTVYGLNLTSNSWDLLCSSTTTLTDFKGRLNHLLHCTQPVFTTKLQIIGTNTSRLTQVLINKLITPDVSPIRPPVDGSAIALLEQLSKDFLNVTAPEVVTESTTLATTTIGPSYTPQLTTTLAISEIEAGKTGSYVVPGVMGGLHQKASRERGSSSAFRAAPTIILLVVFGTMSRLIL